MKDDDDEEADALVCLPVDYGNPGRFDDNVYGDCSRCGRFIQWRPHAPKDCPRICVHCLQAAVRRGETITFAVTADTRAELAAYARARKAEAEAEERGFGRPAPKRRDS